MKKINLILYIITLVIVLLGFTAKENKQTKISTVSSVDGYYLFIESTPVDSFTVLGYVTVPTFSLNNKWSTLKPMMFKRGKEQYPKADGFIITGEVLTNWQAIKFK